MSSMTRKWRWLIFSFFIFVAVAPLHAAPNHPVRDGRQSSLIRERVRKLHRVAAIFRREAKVKLSTLTPGRTFALLFPQEFGWIDSKRAQSRNGGCRNPEQSHHHNCAGYDHGVSRISLIDNLA